MAPAPPSPMPPGRGGRSQVGLRRPAAEPGLQGLPGAPGGNCSSRRCRQSLPCLWQVETTNINQLSQSSSTSISAWRPRLRRQASARAPSRFCLVAPASHDRLGGGGRRHQLAGCGIATTTLAVKPVQQIANSGASAESAIWPQQVALLNAG